jgi:hypothetical protein
MLALSYKDDILPGANRKPAAQTIGDFIGARQ